MCVNHCLTAMLDWMTQDKETNDSFLLINYTHLLWFVCYAMFYLQLAQVKLIFHHIQDRPRGGLQTLVSGTPLPTSYPILFVDPVLKSMTAAIHTSSPILCIQDNEHYVLPYMYQSDQYPISR